jgi:PleD family two-component response regulator
VGFSIDYGARLRVLVVDSDVDSATTLSYLLQVVGCRTAVAFGASMAARVAELFQPSLVRSLMGQTLQTPTMRRTAPGVEKN